MGVLFGGMLTGMGGWVYAQVVMEAQAKTDKMMLNTRESCEDCGFGLVNQSDFWKKQIESYHQIINIKVKLYISLLVASIVDSFAMPPGCSGILFLISRMEVYMRNVPLMYILLALVLAL